MVDENSSTTWEDLTLPLLRYISACKKTDLPRAIGWLASRFNVADSSLNGPFGTAVGSAAIGLRSAGFVEVLSTGSWSTTQLGSEILKNPPTRIDRCFLKGIPQYNEYWEKVRQDNRARAFQDRRFEFYASGRLLLFQGAHTAAPLLLAYSLELHLKAVLCLVENSWSDEDRKLVEQKHDLLPLYTWGRKLGFFKDCRISPDFLTYVQDHFERRYAKSEDKVLARRGGWSFGHSVIHTYDDCITQLDDSLCLAYGDPSLSLGVAAVTGSFTSEALARAFYHCNPFALRRKDQYDQAASATTNRPHVKLPTGRELFAYDVLPPLGYCQSKYEQLLDMRLAALFRLPRKDEPNPDPARLFLSTWQVSAVGYEWVLEKLRKVFGPYAVDIEENWEKHELTVFVFDREAKKWWRSLVLKSNHIPLWFRSNATEAALEAWILETQKQFKSRRNSRL